MEKDQIKKIIIEMWVCGKTGSEIAEKLGLTRCAVMGHVYRLKKAGLIPNDIVKKIAYKKYNQTVKTIPLKETAPTVAFKRGGCRYIVSGSGCDAVFCEKEISRYSYCEHHAKICYVSAKK